MLCGQDEIGLGGDGSGLWELPSDAPAGADLRDYLSLNDQLIEVDLTPNRGDCLSIRGLAREVGVLNTVAVAGPSLDPVSATVDDHLPVVLDASAACDSRRQSGCPVSPVAAGKTAPQRYSQYRPGGRCDHLCDARAGSTDARL